MGSPRAVGVRPIPQRPPSVGWILGASLTAIIRGVISGRVKASLAVQSGLANDVSGAWRTINLANGQTVPIQGTSVQNELSTLTVIGGVQIAL